MSAIVNSGQAYIASRAASGSVTITDFVFANITGLVETNPVDLNEVWPAPGDIVDTVPVTHSGYITPNQVVYSVLLGSDIGDYDFNWIGLKADDGTLVAVSYTPLIQKRKTVIGLTGNNISRSFLTEYADAQSATNITVDASTWQIDFTGRLNTIDEAERLSNLDLYGEQLFFDGGWQVWNDAGVIKVRGGVGYVNGIRIENLIEPVIDPGVLPKDIWLDISLQGDFSGVTADVHYVFNNTVQPDYLDGSNRQHYLFKLASIAAGGAVTDLRNVHAAGGSVVDYLKNHTDTEIQTLKGGVSDAYDTLSELADAIVSVANSLTGKSDSTHLHDDRYARIGIDTTMIFYESSAPVGWSINTSVDDAALKVMSSGGGGVGGSLGFSSTFTATRTTTSAGAHGHSITVNGRSLTIAQMPIHRLPIPIYGDYGHHLSGAYVSGNKAGLQNTIGYTNYIGSGQQHNHSASASSVGNHHHAMNMALKHATVILCDRD